jgi:hypothetical protein
VTLGEARKARDAAKVKAEVGDDPAAAKRRARIAAKLSAGTTLGGSVGVHREGGARRPLPCYYR